MKTILITGHDEAYKPLADLTIPLMKAWAHKQGFHMGVCRSLPKPFNIYWTGVYYGLQHLKDGYERVMYLDVDQAITNPAFELSDYLSPSRHGFHVPRDWGADATSDDECSACCLILHQDCRPILEDIIKLEPKYRDKPFPEQAPLREMLTRHGGIFPVYVHGRKPFNCVPDQVCPGQVPEPWKPGDFTAHLTMVPLQRRIEIFHELQRS